jgi:hypothetical protein
MSKIIKQFEEKIKFTDHVYVTESRKGGLTVRTNSNTTMPKGIYTLWLEGTEDTPRFGMLYLGISGVEDKGARAGAKDRWLAHGYKLTGLGPDVANRASGKPIKLGKSKVDTVLFSELRKDLVELGYDLDTILDKIYVRFIDLSNVGVEKIQAMETRILETRLAKGQCRLNGAKRIPALTAQELAYFDNL